MAVLLSEPAYGARADGVLAAQVALRAALLATSVLFAFPLASAFNLSAEIGALAVVVFLVSARRPEDGVLLLAGLLPMATPLGVLLTPALDGRQAGELLMLAFLVAATARFGLQRSTAASPFALATTVCGVIIAGVTVTSAWRELRGGSWLEQAMTTYLAGEDTSSAFSQGLIWLEAVSLACVADIALRQSPATSARVWRMLVIGGAGASLFTLNRVIQVFLRNDASLSATIDALASVRIGIHARDINAVGSLYAMLVVLAFWFAVTGRRQAWRWAAFASILFALWWTGSRAAVAGACAGVLATAVWAGTFSRRTLLISVSIAIVVVALSFQTAIRPLSSADAVRIRLGMAAIGLRITATHPWFGVGPGRFAASSQRYVSADLAALFPYATRGENAHNNFVQVLAEFGLVGGMALAAVVVIPLWLARGTAARPRPTLELSALVGSTIAFLITCVPGHPLLTPLCLWMFFLVLGLVAGGAAIVRRHDSSQ